MDNALLDMVRGALETLASFEIDSDELPSWDLPLDAPGMTPEVQHAIGFVCGVAAGLNVTPRELVDTVTAPPCYRAMGCVCAAHARGAAASAPCDATERKRAPRYVYDATGAHPARNAAGMIPAELKPKRATRARKG